MLGNKVAIVRDMVMTLEELGDVSLLARQLSGSAG